MLGGIKDMGKMKNMVQEMQKNMKDIPAERVIIETKDTNIVIDDPHVIEMKITGQPSYQISGTVREEKKQPSEEDVKMVMEKTGKDRETVLKKLEELDNDLASAIMELSEDA